jgi:O-antigen/teichoic acid export membrane protein
VLWQNPFEIPDPVRVVQRNVVANLIGQGLAAVVPLVLVPIYIRLLGIEAYGLIGVFATLQGVIALFDMGMSVALNREIARLFRSPERGSIPEIIRTFEFVYWLVGAVVLLIVWLVAPLIAEHWIKASTIPVPVLRTVITLMGVTAAVQFPFSLYASSLLGMQFQVAFNAINVTGSLVRGLGAVAVLVFISRSVQAFFVWQAIAALLLTVAMALLQARLAPPRTANTLFVRSHFNRLWRFAAGVGATGIAAVVLTEADKLIVSKYLPLASFGYYVLAGTVATGLYTITSAIFAAVFPRLSELVALADERAVRDFYHQACQAMSVAVLPTALTLAFFAPQVLLAWTRDPNVAEKAHTVLSILVLGSAFNSMLHIPYALQLASGWTKLGFYQNVIAVAVLLPLMVWGTQEYGAVGAAGAWVVLNLGSMLITIQVMHTRLLPKAKRQWYANDIGLPLAAATATCSLARLSIGSDLQPLSSLLIVGTVACVATMAASLTAPAVRGIIIRRLFPTRQAVDGRPAD